MLHEPAKSTGADPASEYKSRLGVRMFIIYAIVYAGFVVINVAFPLAMDTIVFWGLNLAVVYGFGLIVFAMILALIYNWMCTKKEQQLEAEQPQMEQSERNEPS